MRGVAIVTVSIPNSHPGVQVCEQVKHHSPAAAGYIPFCNLFFLYEFLMAILPSLNVNRSQPVTSTRVPSVFVPVKIHSEKPLFPEMKCLALPQCASGKVKNTFSKAFFTRSYPENFSPSASGPAEASNTQSSVICNIIAFISWALNASANDRRKFSLMFLFDCAISKIGKNTIHNKAVFFIAVFVEMFNKQSKVKHGEEVAP